MLKPYKSLFYKKPEKIQDKNFLTFIPNKEYYENYDNLTQEQVELKKEKQQKFFTAKGIVRKLKQEEAIIEINWRKIPEKETDFFHLTYKVIRHLDIKFLKILTELDYKILGYILYHIRNDGLRTDPPYYKKLLPILPWYNNGVVELSAVSRNTIAEKFNINMRTLDRHLKKIKDLGLIRTRKMPQTLKRPKEGLPIAIQWNPNVYTLTKPLYEALLITYHEYLEAFYVKFLNEEEIKKQKEYFQFCIERTEKQKAERLKTGIKFDIPPPPTVKMIKGVPTPIPSKETSQYGIKPFLQFFSHEGKKEELENFINRITENPNFKDFYPRNSREYLFTYTYQQQLEMLRLIEIEKSGRLWMKYFNKNNMRPTEYPPKLKDGSKRRFTLKNILPHLQKKKIPQCPYKGIYFIPEETRKNIRTELQQIINIMGLNFKTKTIKKLYTKVLKYVYACFEDFVPKDSHYSRSTIDSLNYKYILNKVVPVIFKNYKNVNILTEIQEMSAKDQKRIIYKINNNNIIYNNNILYNNLSLKKIKSNKKPPILLLRSVKIVRGHRKPLYEEKELFETNKFTNYAEYLHTFIFSKESYIYIS